MTMARTHAVVVGGSLAGLSAARVLADRFERVTVVERDAPPVGTDERAGVPQARHVHAMLARGRRELERLFPGFDALVRSRGALVLNFGTDFAVLRQRGWQPRRPYHLDGLFLSRTLVDAAVRELLARHPNVTVRSRTDALGLAGVGRVDGLRVRGRDGGGEETLAADLVVDAGGRGSHAPDWLRAMGLRPPAETVVDSFCGYSTRWYQAPAAERWPREWWWKGIWLDPELTAPREELLAGILSPVEGGRWVVTVGGIGRNYPPSDEDGFTATLDRLRSPILAQAVARAEPVSPVYCSRMMANRFRHYETWAERLPGFLAIGDAACAFNPVYGQGMTAAAVSATALDETLRDGAPDAPDLPARFFARQARCLRDPWDLATGADFRFESTEGARPPMVRLVNRYMDLLFAAVDDDRVVRDVMTDVMHLLRPPAAAFGPGVVARVARHAVAARLAEWRAPGVGRIPPLPAV
jgi:flavin-dependent dehydrogenase